MNVKLPKTSRPPLGSIHHLCALELSALDFLEQAARAGFTAVSMFSQPLGHREGFPYISTENSKAIKQKLADCQLQLANIEVFMLTPDTNVAGFEAAIERGSELGARGATALIYDTDKSRVTNHLAQFAELASQYSLQANLEFTALSKHWNNLGSALALIQSIATNNLKLGLDVLHLIRSGGNAEDVKQCPADLIASMQLSDSQSLAVSNDYIEEAGSSRLPPGEGQFPLQNILAALPAHTALELEVPQYPTRPAAERFAILAASLQRLLNEQAGR